MTDDIEISNPNALIGILGSIEGYDKNNSYLGDFHLEDDSQYDDNTDTGIYYSTDWVYVDQDVTVTGDLEEDYSDYTGHYKYNLKLKKGWNVVYVLDQEDVDEGGSGIGYYSLEVRSSPFKEANLKWVFDGNDSGGKVNTSKQSVKSLKGIKKLR